MGLWPNQRRGIAEFADPHTADSAQQFALVQMHHRTWRGGRWLTRTLCADWLLAGEASLNGVAPAPPVKHGWLQGLLPKV
jgi:hypothetical protein